MEKLFLVKRDTDKYEVEVRKEVGGGHILDCKLSLYNCQAIENGYDLEELSEKEYSLHEINEELYGDSPDLISAYKAGVWDGLKRMAEIFGDKKFTDESLEEFLELSDDMCYNCNAEKILGMMKKTEWEVEIVTEDIPYSKELSESDVRGFEEHGTKIKPIRYKLDKDGCVILKMK
jgi:hypothetical protein